MLDVLEEHLDELGFLWERRQAVLFAPDWTVAELADLEERAEAHLDGLRIGDEHATALAHSRIDGDEAGDVTAAALVLLELGQHGAVLAAARRSGAARDGARIALRHAAVAPAADALYTLTLEADLAVAAFAVDVLAFHRARRPPEPERLLRAADPAVRALGWFALGRLAPAPDAPLLERALDDPDAHVRRAALHAAAAAGAEAVVGLCRTAARGAGAVPEAVAFLGVVGDPVDRPLLEAALRRDPTVAVAGIEGLGSLGDPAGVPALLEAMTVPVLASAAADAFVRTVGPVDLRPHAGTGGAAQSEDDDVPLPDPERARAAWASRRAGMAPGGRWQAGIDVQRLGLEEALARLPLRHGREHWLRLRARAPQATSDMELERLVRHGRNAPIPAPRGGRRER